MRDQCGVILRALPWGNAEHLVHNTCVSCIFHDPIHSTFANLSQRRALLVVKTESEP
jgi:hypothetical protein